MWVVGREEKEGEERESDATTKTPSSHPPHNSLTNLDRRHAVAARFQQDADRGRAHALACGVGGWWCRSARVKGIRALCALPFCFRLSLPLPLPTHTQPNSPRPDTTPPVTSTYFIAGGGEAGRVGHAARFFRFGFDSAAVAGCPPMQKTGVASPTRGQAQLACKERDRGRAREGEGARRERGAAGSLSGGARGWARVSKVRDSVFCSSNSEREETPVSPFSRAFQPPSSHPSHPHTCSPPAGAGWRLWKTKPPRTRSRRPAAAAAAAPPRASALRP